ncbi:hypothetical protein MRB53_014271 [Persea americana]|uniref:Uncharacterized protein n=1 Tax=Persea americana TaxID=3435 RepID=A0ACC2KAA0_PERAE|nr:hypothetical protein MRB53_014271 [Persea americana]
MIVYVSLSSAFENGSVWMWRKVRGGTGPIDDSLRSLSRQSSLLSIVSSLLPTKCSAASTKPGIAPHRREVALPVPLVTGKLLASSPRVAGVRVAVAVLVRRWFPEPELEEEDSRKGAVLGSAGPHLSV